MGTQRTPAGDACCLRKPSCKLVCKINNQSLIFLLKYLNYHRLGLLKVRQQSWPSGGFIIAHPLRAWGPQPSVPDPDTRDRLSAGALETPATQTLPAHSPPHAAVWRLLPVGPPPLQGASLGPCRSSGALRKRSELAAPLARPHHGPVTGGETEAGDGRGLTRGLVATPQRSPGCPPKAQSLNTAAPLGSVPDPSTSRGLVPWSPRARPLPAGHRHLHRSPQMPRRGQSRCHLARAHSCPHVSGRPRFPPPRLPAQVPAATSASHQPVMVRPATKSAISVLKMPPTLASCSHLTRTGRLLHPPPTPAVCCGLLLQPFIPAAGRNLPESSSDAPCPALDLSGAPRAPGTEAETPTGIWNCRQAGPYLPASSPGTQLPACSPPTPGCRALRGHMPFPLPATHHHPSAPTGSSSSITSSRKPA